MNNEASLTSLMSAFARAYHTEHAANPVFCDNAIKKLFTESEYEKITDLLINGADFFLPGGRQRFPDDARLLEEIVDTQLAPTPLARAKFFEDALKNEIRLGAEQYVLLGAGLDTYACRRTTDASAQAMSFPLRVFEIDRSATLADKIKRLKKAGFGNLSDYFPVPVDLARDDLAEALGKAGFDRRRKSVFSMAGLSYYLSETEFGRTLAEISALSSRGSALLLDYADDGLPFSSAPRVKNMLALAAAGGEKMKGFFSPVHMGKSLADYDFSVYEHLSPEEIGARYFSRRDDSLSAFEHIRLLLAVRR